jgi:hypothetical protein
MMIAALYTGDRVFTTDSEDALCSRRPPATCSGEI